MQTPQTYFKVTLKFSSTSSAPLVTEVTQSMTVEELKVIVHAETEAPIDKIKLVFKGKIVKDHETLESLGVTGPGATFIIVINKYEKKKPDQQPKGVVPTNFQTGLGGSAPVGFGNYGIVNHPQYMSALSSLSQDKIQQMMDDPYYQSMMEELLNDPDTLSKMLQDNPMFQQMMKSNPFMKTMLSNPQTLKLILNKDTIKMARQMQKNNKEGGAGNMGMANPLGIGNPLGMGMGNQMGNPMGMMGMFNPAMTQPPSSNPPTSSSNTTIAPPLINTNNSNNSNTSIPAVNPFANNPFMMGGNPFLMGSNPFMMNNPFMMGAANPFMMGANPFGMNSNMFGAQVPFANTNNPTAIPSTTVQSDNLSNNKPTTDQTPGNDSSQNIIPPQPTTSVNQPVAANENQIYQVQLRKLEEMGFTDQVKNIEALKATSGNVQAAIEKLCK